jgi:hypothetical protein
VPRTAATKLPELLDLIEGDRQFAAIQMPVVVDLLDARQMEQRVDEHRSVTTAQDEPIAVGPKRVVGIVAKIGGPELIGNRCQGHRCPWVPAIGRLHPIHAQGADRIDGQLIDGAMGGGHLQQGLPGVAIR